MLHILALFLVCAGAAAEPQCKVIPGNLKQVDAGSGQVWGVNNGGSIYRYVSNNWQNIPGSLIHVSVGPAGVWGNNQNYNIYTYVNNNWMLVSGLLKQEDAGGNKFVVGVNSANAIYCLNQGQIVPPVANPTWTGLDGSLKYYSCGPFGCWGVNSNNNVYYRYNVSPTSCQGTQWQLVDGYLVMVEVGTDGSVYGVNSDGYVFYRNGVTSASPTGTSWALVNFTFSIKHVSYDAGYLWLLSQNGDIFRCKVSGSVIVNI
ncbi:fish-egg lectin-like [Pseudophryne corroboree]|uniref:fish-egg lectin-like n=1 Tax=Pseudophryne corroboree TaxID=495146 RepID=UPI00308137EE